MARVAGDSKAALEEAEQNGADLATLRENLRLSPMQRFAALVAMNRFHGEVQLRTLDLAVRAALEARERDEARERLSESGE